MIDCVAASLFYMFYELKLRAAHDSAADLTLRQGKEQVRKTSRP